MEVTKLALREKQKIRLIGRLDIKGPRLIKGIHLEGLRPVGDPFDFAQMYYNEGIDELIYIDVVASLYERSLKADLVNTATEHCFIPVVAGGGIRSILDAQKLMKAGADKVALNTAAVRSPLLLADLVKKLGSQSVVASIEAKQSGENDWEVYTESGREPSGINVIDWARKVELMGVGEILLTSIDKEGTGCGFDIGLARSVVRAVSIPVIISGGFGSLSHLQPVLETGISGIAVADALHFHKCSISDIKAAISAAGYLVRGHYT